MCDEIANVPMNTEITAEDVCVLGHVVWQDEDDEDQGHIFALYGCLLSLLTQGLGQDLLLAMALRKQLQCSPNDQVLNVLCSPRERCLHLQRRHGRGGRSHPEVRTTPQDFVSFGSHHHRSSSAAESDEATNSFHIYRYCGTPSTINTLSAHLAVCHKWGAHCMDNINGPTDFIEQCPSLLERVEAMKTLATQAGAAGNIPLLQALLDSNLSGSGVSRGVVLKYGLQGACSYDCLETIRFVMRHQSWDEEDTLREERWTTTSSPNSTITSGDSDPIMWLLQPGAEGAPLPRLKSLGALCEQGFGQKPEMYPKYLRAAVELNALDILDFLVSTMGITHSFQRKLTASLSHLEVVCSSSRLVSRGRDGDIFTTALNLKHIQSAVALLAMGQVGSMPLSSLQRYLVLVGNSGMETSLKPRQLGDQRTHVAYGRTVGGLAQALSVLGPLTTGTLRQIVLTLTKEGRDYQLVTARLGNCVPSSDATTFFSLALGIPLTATGSLGEVSDQDLYRGTHSFAVVQQAVRRASEQFVVANGTGGCSVGNFFESLEVQEQVELLPEQWILMT